MVEESGHSLYRLHHEVPGNPLLSFLVPRRELCHSYFITHLAPTQTFCIKEASEYLIIQDMDDFLVPKNGKTYIDEFRNLKSIHPNSAYFIYSRRSVQYEKSEFNASVVYDTGCAKITCRAQAVFKSTF